MLDLILVRFPFTFQCVIWVWCYPLMISISCVTVYVVCQTQTSGFGAIRQWCLKLHVGLAVSFFFFFFFKHGVARGVGRDGILPKFPCWEMIATELPTRRQFGNSPGFHNSDVRHHSTTVGPLQLGRCTPFLIDGPAQVH